MNPQNSEKLFAAAPDFFKVDPKKTFPFDFEGFAIGNGWVKPVLGMAKKIQSVLNTLPAKERHRYRCAQIKTKFAGLRVYTEATTPEIQAAIHEATLACADLCEECGKPGRRVSPTGWISVLCQDHFRHEIRTKILQGVPIEQINLEWSSDKEIKLEVLKSVAAEMEDISDDFGSSSKEAAALHACIARRINALTGVESPQAPILNKRREEQERVFLVLGKQPPKDLPLPTNEFIERVHQIGQSLITDFCNREVLDLRQENSQLKARLKTLTDAVRLCAENSTEIDGEAAEVEGNAFADLLVALDRVTNS